MSDQKIVLTFPDGSPHEFSAGVTGAEVAASIGSRLAKDAVAVKVNGELVDTARKIDKSGTFAVVTPKSRDGKLDKDALWCIRHTAEHVMTEAICRLWPETKLVYGPPVEDGFYGDIDLDHKISIDDFPKIEAEMQKIIAENRPMTRYVLPRDEGMKKIEAEGNPYKLENARAAQGDLSFYVTGANVGKDFEDLCMGPHVPATGRIGAFKLTAVAGAYFRGDENNKQLQRIYGTAFSDKKDLDAHLAQLEEAKKRDHRKLGKELGIYIIDEDVGPGLPLWLPNGGVLIEELENLAKVTEQKAGYVRVRTPHITKSKLYEISGHLELYKDKMYPPMKLDDDVEYYLKPMNCPHHHKIYAAQPKSYRDLPLRLAEYGTCYRFEQSGELFGLMRVRSMQMNDAHIYCTIDQFEQEFLAVCNMYLEYFRIFGVKEYVMRLSTHSKDELGKKYVNEPELWLKTEEMVRRAMQHGNVPFVEVQNEAAFYGPKIDVQVWSAIGREFTLATNQVDFAVPRRFGLTYRDHNNHEATPLCIHRAPLGTHERFIGFLIEHFAGLFPLWLAPVQMRVANITEQSIEAAKLVVAQLRAEGLRVDEDISASGNIKQKVKESEEAKIPYLLVVGDREAASNSVAVRGRGRKDLGVMPVAEFLAKVKKEVADRAL